MKQPAPKAQQPPRIPEDVETVDGRRRFFNTLIEWMDREINRRHQIGTAQSSVLLTSPNGSVYEVKVSNAGVLSATLVYNAT